MPAGWTDTARIGRFAALLLLLLAAWNPSFPTGRAALQLTVLIDESASMDRDWLADAWPALRERLVQLPAGSRVSLLRFAGDHRIEWRGDATPAALPARLPRSGPLDTTATDLSGALRAAFALRDPVRANTLLLLSDGRDTGPNADQASLGLDPGDSTLLWWRPAQGDAPGPAIAGMHAPVALGAGEPLTLLVRITGDMPADTRLRIAIDGQTAVVQSAAAGGLPVPITLPNPGTGLHRIEAGLVQGGNLLDRRLGSVQVEGASRVLVVSADGRETPLAASLAAGGWPVRVVAAEEVDSGLFASAEVVVLDDLAVADLPAAVWQALAQRVRGRGLGLIVLGGARAFAAGGYRDSVLEDLLPLTAQAPKPLPPAAVLFLIDQSGSMGRPADGARPGRLALAQRAVIEAAGALQPTDLVGLITFAMEPRERVPLTPRRDVLEALHGELGLQAQGGTLITPALRQGLQLLATSGVETRLLVVATDGVLDEPAELLRAAVDEAPADVRIVVLLVGAEAQAGPLAPLATAGAAEVMRVAEVADLPRLMRQRVEQLRAPVETGAVRPLARGPLPFLAARPPEWPLLQAYAVTSPRPAATLYLAAPNGDPLLAGWHAGTGRVLALPGGLGHWAAAWPAWPHWGALAGGLVEWAAGGRAADLHLEAHRQGAAWQFTLDAVDASGQWSDAMPDVTLTGPDGVPAEIAAGIEAPGLYRLRPVHRAPGRYDLDVRLEGQTRHLAYLYEPEAEMAAGTPVAPYLAAALAAGKVAAWRPADAWPGPAGRSTARGPLLALALLTFVATLVAERGLHARLAQTIIGKTRHLGRRWA